ncbi:MAG: hypothetical protein Q8L47_00610 [bacterium]|nr:hypothetical protein [bacterium]
MVNLSPEIDTPIETKRAETAANKFYDMADKARAEEEKYPQEERHKEEMFSSVGRETAQGNFSGAQHILERGAYWDDNLRSDASEINQLDQERRGLKPMSFAEAQNAIGNYARLFEGDNDAKAAAEIDSIVDSTSRPEVEGIDTALNYIEGTLKSKVNVADFTSKGAEKEFIEDWQEKRAIRDALYREKQKRAEQMKQSQHGTEKLAKGRGETAHTLDSLFGQAAIPEDRLWRQKFSARVGHMAPEELHFLNDALKKTLAEFARTGRTKEDTDRLETRLSGLSTMSFSSSAVERRRKEEDQKKIKQIRAELRFEGVIKTPTNEAPKQERGQTESKIENSFQSFVDSPETYLDRLKNVDGPNTYSQKKAIGAVMEVLQKLYPDKKQRTNRIQEIFGQYGALRDEDRKKRPGADESSHENFGTNQTAQRLSGAERQALEKIIADKIDIQYANGGSMKFTKEYVLGSFIQFLERI